LMIFVITSAAVLGCSAKGLEPFCNGYLRIASAKWDDCPLCKCATAKSTWSKGSDVVARPCRWLPLHKT
jgi:hypothetical protein